LINNINELKISYTEIKELNQVIVRGANP